MIDSKKVLILFAIAVITLSNFARTASAQERDRIVRTVSSRPVNSPPQPETPVNDTQAASSVRQPLLQEIRVSPSAAAENPSLVRKTVSSAALLSAIAASRSAYSPAVTSAMQRAIFVRLEIPYRYGASGPNSYDCSGFVWAVFADAGIDFERQSARNLWAISAPVFGDDRFKFGTLVFFNGRGHVGIVVDENGFFHASSSKGITYSPFKGYWEKRIVGFRRLNPANVKSIGPKDERDSAKNAPNNIDR
ncbi:MAG: hypothetical protein C4325_03725 [Blastocatellia bacterium]